MGRRKSKKRKGQAQLRRSKDAKVVRRSSEFDMNRMLARMQAPRETGIGRAWTLSQIFAARDAQLRGHFALPVQAAAAARTDDAIFSAWDNRLAPLRALDVELKAATDSALAKRVAREASALFGKGGIALHPDTLSDIHSDLVDHGIAVAYLEHHVRDDGSRVDVEVKPWPLEFVDWDRTLRCLVTRVDVETEVDAITGGPTAWGYGRLPIIHGDGRWIVFQSHDQEPWAKSAAILPAMLVWARHAYALRDWAKASTAHGNAKVVGEMPEGMALEDEDGGLTPQAEAFLNLLKAIASVEAPVGIRPSGSKTEFITNNSTAWQVWDQLVNNAEKAAARIYLGTDGMLGSVGGAPGVDIQALFGVATTKVQSDDGAISRGLNTGAIIPWTAINFGDSSLAPCRKYKRPDGDARAERQDFAERMSGFNTTIAELRDNGFRITPELVAEVAGRFDVPVPKLDVADDQGGDESSELVPTPLAAAE